MELAPNLQFQVSIVCTIKFSNRLQTSSFGNYWLSLRVGSPRAHACSCRNLFVKSEKWSSNIQMKMGPYRDERRFCESKRTMLWDVTRLLDWWISARSTSGPNIQDDLVRSFAVRLLISKAELEGNEISCAVLAGLFTGLSCLTSLWSPAIIARIISCEQWDPVMWKLSWLSFYAWDWPVVKMVEEVF